MDNTARPLNYGEKAVGITFNPGGDDSVNRIKQIMANAINEMDALRTISESPEVKRMCSVAITEMQTAQMWAVKAITWKD
jgi:hypothetical protein